MAVWAIVPNKSAVGDDVGQDVAEIGGVPFKSGPPVLSLQ